MSRYYFPIQNGKQIISTYSGIKDIADHALRGLGNKNAKDVSFPDLENVSGRFALYQSFNSSEMLETISFPKLETIDGYRSLYQGFSGCSNLQSIAFPELKTLVAVEAMYQAFSSCSQLGSVNFSKLETVRGSFSMYGAFSFCTSLIISSWQTCSAAFCSACRKMWQTSSIGACWALLRQLRLSFSLLNAGM